MASSNRIQSVEPNIADSANFYEYLLALLKTDTRFVAKDGTFLRNAVYEATMKMDEKLIRLLLSRDETKSRFFTNVNSTYGHYKIFEISALTHARALCLSASSLSRNL